MRSFKLLFLFISLFLAQPLLAQVSLLSNRPTFNLRTLSTSQRGKLPLQDDTSFQNGYSEFQLDLTSGFLSAGIRVEGYTAPFLDSDYAHVSQFYAAASWDWGSLRAGHFYAMLGKGLLLRSFELPGFIYESRVFRQQHRIVRDLRGARLSLQRGPVQVLLLRGTPVDALQPPDDSARREGEISAAQVAIDLPYSANIGGAYMELQKGAFNRILATRFLSWSADDLLSALNQEWLSADFYVEFATQQGVGATGSLKDELPQALYVTGSLAGAGLGAVIEFKDYSDFDLGFNDPPPLIRENSYHLLNRTTHVLDALDESGHQLELFYTPVPEWKFTGNYTLAVNQTPGEDLLFQERLLEAAYIGDAWNAAIFFDSGQDDLLFDTERRTAGVSVDRELDSGLTLGGELQWQKIRRALGGIFDYDFPNQYLNLRLQGLGDFGVSFSAERSQDPDITESTSWFPNTRIAWTPTHQINAQLFAGKRRRGTACDHGFCIEVLDFEGIELRLETTW